MPPGTRALPTDQIQALIKEDRASFTKMALDLHDSVLPVLQAIEAKDKDKLLEVGDGINQTCENCHIKYRGREEVRTFDTARRARRTLTLDHCIVRGDFEY